MILFRRASNHFGRLGCALSHPFRDESAEWMGHPANIKPTDIGLCDPMPENPDMGHPEFAMYLAFLSNRILNCGPAAEYPSLNTVPA